MKPKFSALGALQDLVHQLSGSGGTCRLRRQNRPGAHPRKRTRETHKRPLFCGRVRQDRSSEGPAVPAIYLVAVQARFGNDQLIQLTGAIGYYFDMTVNACELEVAPGAEVFKP